MKLNLLTINSCLLGLAATTALAQAPATPAEIKYPWESSANAGLSLTRGNSQTLMFTAGLETIRKTPVNEYAFGVNGAYGTTDSVKSADLFHAYGQWNHLFTERTYSYVRADGLRDGIADINYRFMLSPGVGYYFVKEKNTLLAGEVGPGVVIQELGHDQTTYATLRLAERFEHKFNGGGARVWQTLEFLPQVDKLDNYIANFEVGVESALSKSLSLQVVLSDTFNNRPALDRQKNDVKLVAGVKYKF